MKHLLDKENDNKQHERGKEKHVCLWIDDKRQRSKERQKKIENIYTDVCVRERERERERELYQEFLL